MSFQKIFVSEPFMPPLSEVVSLLEKVWENKWVTNNGQFHQELENKLADYLGVPYISLFTNCTIALISAIKVSSVCKKVITTPFSFVATSHALSLLGIEPVFADIDPVTLNLDTKKIEQAITEEITGILPVHCYGNSCDVIDIQNIANTHHLQVIYDAAHAFAVENKTGSILNFGRFSVLSFHATKVFNTFEGGAVVSQTEDDKAAIDRFKNFSFLDEVNIEGVGLNGKMSEFNSALGIVQLDYIDNVIQQRKKVSDEYISLLNASHLYSPVSFEQNAKHNYSYFPILCSDNKLREISYHKLRENNIYARRYFYPLISNVLPYSNLESANPSNLPVANAIADRILCLPIHSGISSEDARMIANHLLKL